jgi:hypothetical protein
VRIAVVPVRGKRMAEDDDAHRAGHTPSAGRSSCAASSR